MNWLTLSQQRDIQAFAAQVPDKELCGFVLENGTVVLCQNIAVDPHLQFEISPAEYAVYEARGIKGVWHTHLELDSFSPTDQMVMASDTLPWAVYCLRTDRFHQCDPTAKAPLLGRPFCFGVYDCYSLVSDKLAELVKEFDSILTPSGRVLYLGTPQCEDSLYTKLPERGYSTRIWPRT